MDKNTKNEQTVGEKIGELAIKTGGYKEMNQEQLRKEYNIRGYPTIVDIEGGKQVGEYSGERNENAFIEHAYSFTS